MNIRLDQNGISSGPEMNADAGLYSRGQIQGGEKNGKTTGHDNRYREDELASFAAGANGVNIQLGNRQNPGILDYDKNSGGNSGFGDNGHGADNSAGISLSDLENQKKYMMIMSTSVSDEELEKLQKEGFAPGEMKPEEIVTVVDEIKMQLAASGTVIAGYNDDLDMAQLEEMTGSRAYSNAIKESLSKYELPETEQNVEQMTKALEQALELTRLSDSAKAYLLQNGQEPTLRNMYLAMHSGVAPTGSGEGYYRAGNGYLGYQVDLQEQDMEALQDQISQMLEQNDMEISEENLQGAKWLLQNNVPLTEENLKRQREMEEMKFPLDPWQTADAIARSIKDGESPMDAVPGRVESIEQKVLKLQNELSKMQELADLQDGSAQQAALTNHLQLEEARLRLTLSTGAYLLKNGISPDVSDLTHLVEQLKAAQNHINEILFLRGNAAENKAAANLWQQTGNVVKAIPLLPAQTLGRIAFQSSFSLQIVYNEGKALEAQYQGDAREALRSYETLMTAPRADLGDSITKAFRNVDDLLAENDIAVTETNQKAARILGYNGQEITKENILAVGEAYEKVSRIIRKMTPGATLSLIRDKINPLEMNLDELEQHLDQQDQSPEKDVEKYSRFLVRLEEKHEISQQERESYIGIYRMLYQIEKNDHASIGALMRQGGELTFKNLLTNARNRAMSGMDFQIDDSFGFLEKTVSAGVSITDQLYAAFDGDGVISDGERTSNATNDGVISDGERSYYKEINRMIRDAGNVSTQALELLEDNQVPVTVEHLLAAETMVQRPVGMFETMLFFTHPEDFEKAGSGRSTKLSGKKSRDIPEFEDLLDKEEFLKKEGTNLLENFTDASNAKQAYEAMANRMQDYFTTGIGRIKDRIDLREISFAMKQISLASSMAKEENYEIPMWFGEELAAVNVRIVHTKENQGKMSIHAETEKFGMVHAVFISKEEGLDGFVVCQNRDIMEMLKENKDALPEEIRRLDFAQNERMSVNNFKQSADEKSKGAEDAGNRERISTKRLYETAKAFLTLLHTYDK
ncbi:MAG: DUF6240 domain-containing protein [Lachnospiraceae bacterium]